MFKERKDRVFSSSSSASLKLSSQVQKGRVRLTQEGSVSKKGQVTIFIILGILLLLIVGLVILLQTEVISFKAEGVVLSEGGKVGDFIGSCILSVGEQALVLAGQQGGYIEVPERYSSDLNWHIPLSSFLDVPLWANGLTVDKPSLDEVKFGVDRYVEEHVRECLFSTGVFEESYNLVENTPILSDVQFDNGKTRFEVSWNILVEDVSGELVTELVSHVEDSSIQFKEMYELADAILIDEMNTLKLEDITQDLIALEHEYVPVSGIALSCQPKQWKVDTAESTLQDLLRVNLRELQIEGTDVIDFPDTLPYYQNHYVWDVGADAKDLSVTFRYDNDFPFTFQVTPRDGAYLQSNQLTASDYLPLLCIQNWKFTYDVVYPVIIEVRDRTGTAFQIATSVNLIRNFPNKGETVVARASGESGIASEEFCEESGHYVPMNVLTYSLVENRETGVYDTEPLEDANVSYSCLSHSCEIGSTVYDFAARGDVAGLTAEFPYCASAIVRAEKENYIEDWVQTPAEEGKDVALYLTPLHEISLSNALIAVHEMTTRDCTAEEEAVHGEDALCYHVGEAQEMAADQTALVTLRYIAPTQETLEAELYGEVEEDDAFGETEGETVEEDAEQELEVEEQEELGSLDFGFSGLEGSGYEELFKEDIILSPSLDEGFLEESSFRILAGADFTYDVTIYLTDEDELIGAYSGEWIADWSTLAGPGAGVVFHVMKTNPADEEVFFDMIARMDDLSVLLPEVEVLS